MPTKPSSDSRLLRPFSNFPPSTIHPLSFLHVDQAAHTTSSRRPTPSETSLPVSFLVSHCSFLSSNFPSFQLFSLLQLAPRGPSGSHYRSSSPLLHVKPLLLRAQLQIPSRSSVLPQTCPRRQQQWTISFSLEDTRSLPPMQHHFLHRLSQTTSSSRSTGVATSGSLTCHHLGHADGCFGKHQSGPATGIY